MDLHVKNFGTIADANIALTGITVLCGDDDTGKTTIAKALFCFCNALNDNKNRIDQQKVLKTISILNQATEIGFSFDSKVNAYQDKIEGFIYQHKGEFTVEEITDFITSVCQANLDSYEIKYLTSCLNLPLTDLLNQSAYNVISSAMHSQIKNYYVPGRSKCIIADGEEPLNSITVGRDICECKTTNPFLYNAYYIDTPAIADYLNVLSERTAADILPIRKKLLKTLTGARYEDIMSISMEYAQYRVGIKKIDQLIKKIYSGNIILDNGRYYYCLENKARVDIRNTSPAFKIFFLFDRIVQDVILRNQKNDILILDELDNYLSAEKQDIYAEIVVMLQKTFGTTVLVNTHDSEFAKKLFYYMTRHGTDDCISHYTAVSDSKGFIWK